jgi:hypothetical protein
MTGYIYWQSVCGVSIKRISGVISAEEIEVVNKVKRTLRQASLDKTDTDLGKFLERLHPCGHGLRREHLPKE